MLKKERQLYILKKVEKEGLVITNELKEELGVAEDTIRKDFQQLSAQGKVKRIHGGVLRIEKNVEKGIKNFDDRVEEQVTVKEKLAKKALEFVINEHVVYIDGGTTNLKLAELMPEDYIGTIITNAPTIGLALCKCSNAKINMIGGDLDKTAKNISGSSAIGQIRQLNIGLCVLGVSSLSVENGITFPISDEAFMKREIVNHSQKVIVIASKEKIERIAAFYCADIGVVDILVTNEKNEEILEKYRKCGIQVIVVGA